MSKQQAAGASVLGKLRDRIVSGLYLGYWRPGERLPSIREIADGEDVDRKTAAAAYRRLQEEGLVRVRPRSGIYLCAQPLPDPPGPLERLQRQWLEHTYEGARALGLGTGSILRVIEEVAEVERLRLPVVECNWNQAEALAAELRERLDLHAVPYLLEELRPGDPALMDAPLIVTTPYHSADVALVSPGRTIIETALAPEVLRELRRRATRGRCVVVTGNAVLAEKVRRALELVRLTVPRAQLVIVSAEERGELVAAAARANSVFLWPGAPAWVEEVLLPTTERYAPPRAISEAAIARIQLAVLDAAIRRSRTPARAEVEMKIAG